MSEHPQVAAYRSARASAGTPPLYTQTLAQARAADLAAIRAGGGAVEPVHEVRDTHVPGPGGEVPVRIYRPAAAGPLPTLVYLFGGGWTLGSVDTADGICRGLANAVPCQVITVGYRLAPEHPFPAAVHDSHAALRWIAAHPEAFGVDPQRIAVGGDSAGGNLAAAVTLLARDCGGPRLAAQLLVYPNTDQSADPPGDDDPLLFNRRSVAWYRRHYLADPADARDPLASPLLAEELRDLPPALVVTAEHDPLRAEGQRYAHRLRAAGVPTVLSHYPGMIHGFFAMPGTFDDGRRAQQEAAAFLRRHLRPADPPVRVDAAGVVGAGEDHLTPTPESTPPSPAQRGGGGAVAVADFAELARAVLPADVWDYVAGGSGAEHTLAANRRALDRVAVLPRVLRGVHTPRTAARLLGADHDLPVAVAPMAYQRLLHPDGEVGLAAAAGAAGVPYVASTLSSEPIERIVEAGRVVWFQLYWLRDRALVADLLDRAHAAGCAALTVTVDVPILGHRLRDVRNGFALPPHVVAANLPAGRDDLAHRGTPGVSAVAAHTGAVFAPALTWADLEWLRGRTPLPLVVKGVLDPRDAALAADLGADAVVVSNHGGRQLDGAPASADALPEVVDVVADRCEVLLDSGIRGGVDVLRALALGAHGVLIGRPMLWALAVGGRAGASAALHLLAAEFADALTLAGCADPAAARQLRTARMD